MDEDQEMEKFGMENDYEGGTWINGEFYYRSRKEKRRQTKEDVLYGVFADYSDSDDDDGFARKRRKDKNFGGKPDYTKPVNFVSTASMMPNEEIDKLAKEKNGMDKSIHDNEQRPGLGMGTGLGFAHSGLGFAGGSSGTTDGDDGPKTSKGEEENEDEHFLTSEMGRRIKEGAQRRERERLERKDKGGGTRKSKEGRNGDVGIFEEHTKGIGMKLLQQMGYRGGGLGKNEQGIVAPIETKMRPKGMGMGYNDYKEVSAKVSLVEEEKKSLTSQVQSLAKGKERMWLKGKKKQTRYLTAEQLLENKEEENFEVVQKVIDMRGPQVKVLMNLENLNAEETAKNNDIPMPELQHNIRLLVDQAEVDVIKLDRDLRNERETAISLQKEKEKLGIEVERQKQLLDDREEIASTLGHIQEQSSVGTLSLESLGKLFTGLKRRYPDDYELCNLSLIACSFALPMFIRNFQGWDPLTNPGHGFQLIESWKPVLQSDTNTNIWDMTTPYGHLVSEVILPAVRISGINTWEPREPEPMLTFLESWEKILPSSVIQSILDTVVLPKLTTAVDIWDPRRETVPIHVWVHPWLPHLGQRLEMVYQTIRMKLSMVLDAWHPSDASAHAILSPWKTVFDSVSWEGLMRRFILPKLQISLQEFQINPANQNMLHFDWVKRWTSEIPTHLMVELLETFFFSKWQQVLYHWLTSNPKLEEIGAWFKGWKDSLPAELLAHENIRYQFAIGLKMIEQAAEGLEILQPGLKENLSYIRAQDQIRLEGHQRAAAYVQQRMSGTVNGGSVDSTPLETLKEIIEAHAQHHGLLFKPKPGRTFNGHQIYGYGNVNIYVDSIHSRVYAQKDDQWILTNLDKLLEMHSSLLRKR